MLTYDSQGKDITCMKQFDVLKYPCDEFNIKDCKEREEGSVMRKMKLSDIKINETFASSTPKESKMDECRYNWNTWHRQDREIVVNHNNVLIDGYIQYLVLKENGVNEAEVKISNERKKRWYRKDVAKWENPYYRHETTTYIYGFHPNAKEPKELVWRVPKAWKGWENDLLPGDRIIVSTKNGFAPIIITKIEWLDKPPVDTPIKRVVTKCFDYDTTNAKINSLLDKIMNVVYRMESNCEEKQGVEDYRIFDDIAEIEDAIENIQRMI